MTRASAATHVPSINSAVLVVSIVLLLRISADAFSTQQQQQQRQPRLPVRFFNSFARQKQPFVPHNPSRVSFYSCGPTLHDYAHIGNLRAFITYDVVKRWLRFAGYTVEHVCNLTDVDDKIVRKAQAEKTNRQNVTSRYAEAFFEDLSLLNVLPADHYPHATNYIPHILKFIGVLVKKGHAYEKNGSVYFRTASFPGYGSFGATQYSDSRGNVAELATDKEDPRDFALWKAVAESDDDSVWDSPFGKGRPGWHIECSAMCQSHFGDTVDIHAGGVDLQFPHHHNEIAQSEAATGKQFCKHWIHNGFITIGNGREKMSKTLGGFRTLRSIASAPLHARAFRHFVVSSHYRAPLHFTEDCISASVNTLTKIDKLMQKLAISQEQRDKSDTEQTTVISDACEQAMNQFTTSMSDDMHTPTAITALHGLINQVEQDADAIGSADATLVLSTIAAMDQVLGLFYDVPNIGPFKQYPKPDALSATVPKESLAPHIQRLIDDRTKAKQNLNFSLADKLRSQLLQEGYQLIDSKAETQIFRLQGS